MSFEGYFQLLCKNGHYDSEDVNMMDRVDKLNCKKCGRKIVWWNLVDQTNGSFEDNKRIDGYVELKVKKDIACDKCGTVLERIYKIPRKRKK